MDKFPYFCSRKPYNNYHMENNLIFLKLKPFIRQWLVHHFGDPVKFDAQSVLNAKIISVLTRGERDIECEGDTAVVSPYSKQKEPPSWCHVSQAGKKFIIDHIESIFLLNLWNEMSAMCSEDSKIQSAAYAWCEMHGIDIDYADIIRMRYYREKIKMLRKGIDLRAKKRNK